MAIIFIPGIKATALANVNSFDFNLMYENYDTLGAAVGTAIMGVRFEEQLQENPKHDLSSDIVLERNHVMTYPYKNSIRDISTYTGEPVYIFGYDWRKSNVDNALLLSGFVNNLKEKLGEKTQFSFLTHSMGALVLGCYLKTLDKSFSNINRIVFTAPPFRGGMEALKHMAMGNGGLRGFLNIDEGSRKAIRTYPALYELCPWYDGAVKDVHGNNVDLSLKEHWQTSIYDDAYMKKIFPARVKAMLDYRKNQMADLNELPVSLRNKCLIVAGTGSDTLKEVQLKKDTDGSVYYNFKHDVHTDEGDCTVPIVSSTIYKDKIKTITVEKGSFFQEGMASVNYHALFLTHSKVLNVVKRFLSAKTDFKNVDWYKSIGDDDDVRLLK